MYHPNRMLALFGALIGAECAIAGAACANELMVDQVEVLETILSFIAFLCMGIIGTTFAFVRWFIKRWPSGQLDSETLKLVEKLKTDADLSPLLSRLDEQDHAIKTIVEHLGESIAKQKLKAGWDD